MSIDDQIFLDPGHHDARAAAVEIAAVVDGRFVDHGTGVGVGVPLENLGPGLFTGGPIYYNEPIEPVRPDDPEDREIFDSYPIQWSMKAGPRRDEDLGRAAAKEVFHRLVTSGLGWPLVLAHNIGELVATYDVERGIREFPPGTRSDGTDEHLWR